MIRTLQEGNLTDEVAVPLTRLCGWFGVPRRTVYYKPTQLAEGRSTFCRTDQSPDRTEAILGYRTVAWTLDVLRLVATLYLGWLAWKSGRSALATYKDTVHLPRPPSGRSNVRGLIIHLTNPKAILFFGALYSVGLPPGTSPLTVFFVAAAVGVQSGFIFVMLALLFSHGKVATGYARMRRVFEAVFAIVFGAASVGFLIALLRRAPT